MRIQNDGINKMLNIYKSQANIGSESNIKKANKSDQLNISDAARDFQTALKEVNNQSDVREKKVEDIKRQIERGTYKVDAKRIAEKMMQDANIYTKL